MSNFYGATSLIGGGTGALDAIDGAALTDLDGAVAVTNDKAYFYWLDDDSAATESPPAIITPDTNGGTKRWLLTSLISAGLEVIKDAANATVTISCYHDTEATTPLLTFRKADNTEASPALVDDNAVLGTIHFDGYDGSGWHTGAKVEARIDGTPSDGTDMPTELTFWTCPDNSATLVQRMTIDPDGLIGVGTVSPQSELHIVSDSDNVDLMIERTGASASLLFLSAQADAVIIGSNSDDAVLFVSNSAEQMRLTTTGRLGIDDNNPGEMLDVNGNINATGVIKIDDTQVVKEQQVHIADAPGDTAANNATTINAILLMIEAHGLIAAA